MRRLVVLTTTCSATRHRNLGPRYSIKWTDVDVLKQFEEADATPTGKCLGDEHSPSVALLGNLAGAPVGAVSGGSSADLGRAMA